MKNTIWLTPAEVEAYLKRHFDELRTIYTHETDIRVLNSMYRGFIDGLNEERQRYSRIRFTTKDLDAMLQAVLRYFESVHKTTGPN